MITVRPWLTPALAELDNPRSVVPARLASLRRPRLERQQRYSSINRRPCIALSSVGVITVQPWLMPPLAGLGAWCSSNNNRSICTVMHTRSPITAPFDDGGMALRKLMHTNDHRRAVASMQPGMSRLTGPHHRRLPPSASCYRGVRARLRAIRGGRTGTSIK